MCVPSFTALPGTHLIESFVRSVRSLLVPILGLLPPRPLVLAVLGLGRLRRGSVLQRPAAEAGLGGGARHQVEAVAPAAVPERVVVSDIRGFR